MTINAARRLTIEAHESGSMAPLVPADKYVPHWMTGGEVLYVGCRDGYDRSLISTTEKDGGICFDGDGLCGLSAFPMKPVMINCDAPEGAERRPDLPAHQLPIIQ